jgi:hypothetical protein
MKLMDDSLTNCKVESASLRAYLEDCLTRIFITGKIGKYLDIDAEGPEIQILKCSGEQVMTPPGIRLAYRIWLAMDQLDRYMVLCKFHHFYSALPVTRPGEGKTLIFCALFIHEFAAILVEASEWQD